MPDVKITTTTLGDFNRIVSQLLALAFNDRACIIKSDEDSLEITAAIPQAFINQLRVMPAEGSITLMLLSNCTPTHKVQVTAVDFQHRQIINR